MGKRRKTNPLFYNFKAPRRMCTFYGRLEKVKDPKTAFFYLLDNVADQNSGKFIESRSARGEYYWVERSRGEDQCYFIVRKRGNNITVIRRRWLIDGKGTNLFLGAIAGFEKEPVPEDTVVLVSSGYGCGWI